MLWALIVLFGCGSAPSSDVAVQETTSAEPTDAPTGHAASLDDAAPVAGNGDGAGEGEADAATGSLRIAKGADAEFAVISEDGDVQTVLARNQARFRTCYELGLKTQPELQGRVVVRFEIDEGGEVQVAEIAEATLDDETVHTCVVNQFKRLRFGEGSAGAKGTFPLVFSPD